MRVRYLIALLAATAIAPVAAQAQYAPADAAAGAASDAATAILAPPPPPVVTYVEREDIPSVTIERDVVVGEPLPRTVVLHRVPKYHYEYAVVNHRRVIVEPKTRRVVKIIE